MLNAISVNLFSTASRPSEYLSLIGKNLSATNFSSQGAILAIWILCGVVVALLFAIMVTSYRKRKLRYMPVGHVATPQGVSKLLLAAIKHRSKFEMQFHTPDTRRLSTICSAIAIEKDVLVLECSRLGKLYTEWTDKPVRCFFNILDNEYLLYYMFTSKILSTQLQKNGVYVLRLQLPTKLDQRQKRAFFRIGPPEQYVLGLALWTKPFASDGTLSPHVKSWGKPDMLHMPDKPSGIEILNISAGGIRLRISRSVSKKQHLAFRVSERFILLLDLWEPELGKRERYWLLCRVQATASNFETQDVELGVQFIGLAKSKEGQIHEIEWLPTLADEGVEGIGNWTMKRHLEMYRKQEAKEE